MKLSGAKHSPASRLVRFFWFFATFLLFLSGCGRKQPAPNEIRAVTRQLVFAARETAGPSTEIGMRPERTFRPGQPPPKKSDRAPEPVPDCIYITIPTTGTPQGDAIHVDLLRHELDRIAGGHGLVRQDRPGTAGIARFDYLLRGQRTHSVEIITRYDLTPGGVQPGAPRLAIIVDDLGYDRGAADSVLALSVPVTLSVLPHLAHSAEIAEEAHRRGYEVLLHMPMESNDDSKHEEIELRRSTAPAETLRLLDAMLDTVPFAAGVNNHQGSLATSDRALMDGLMPALRDKGLFFVDSRTSASTVAFDAARAAGVRAASRNVFLDDVDAVDAVRQQLELAVRDAEKSGAAIAIGHPHPATLSVLHEVLPQLAARGVRLVFVSELVR